MTNRLFSPLLQTLALDNSDKEVAVILGTVVSIREVGEKTGNKMVTRKQNRRLKSVIRRVTLKCKDQSSLSPRNPLHLTQSIQHRPLFPLIPPISEIRAIRINRDCYFYLLPTNLPKRRGRPLITPKTNRVN